MDAVLYESIRALEAHNWWFVGMRAIARTLLAPLPRFHRAVDIGCGSGGNLGLLREVADEVFAVDLSPTALKFTRERLGKGEELAGLVGADAQRLPLADASVDLVWLFNVVEHLPDDAAAFAEAQRVLRPGGWAVIATSASMWLWSDHDVANHHQRRYTAPQLRERIEHAGLKVRRLTHANAALFAPTAAVALLHRTRARLFGRPAYLDNAVEVNPVMDRMFRGLLLGEAKLLKGRDLPFGVSLFALAEKA